MLFRSNGEQVDRNVIFPVTLLQFMVKFFFLKAIFSYVFPLCEGSKKYACYYLGSTDAGPEKPHLRPTLPDVATCEGRRRLLVSAASGRVLPLFFFFFYDSRRRGSDLGRFALNRADSCRLGPYRPYQAKPPKHTLPGAEQENENKRKMDKNL